MTGQTVYLHENILKNPVAMKQRGYSNYQDSVRFCSANSIVTSFLKIAASGGLCTVPGYLTSYRQYALTAVPMRRLKPIVLTAASKEPFTRDMKLFLDILRQEANDDL